MKPGIVLIPASRPRDVPSLLIAFRAPYTCGCMLMWVSVFEFFKVGVRSWLMRVAVLSGSPSLARSLTGSLGLGPGPIPLWSQGPITSVSGPGGVVRCRHAWAMAAPRDGERQNAKIHALCRMRSALAARHRSVSAQRLPRAPPNDPCVHRGARAPRTAATTHTTACAPADDDSQTLTAHAHPGSTPRLEATPCPLPRRGGGH